MMNWNLQTQTIRMVSGCGCLNKFSKTKILSNLKFKNKKFVRYQFKLINKILQIQIINYNNCSRYFRKILFQRNFRNRFKSLSKKFRTISKKLNLKNR